VASPAVSRVGEARLAGAIARLLRWEAQLLARPTHDAASRSAALRGLEWAADFARALDAEPCAAWLDALRERANDRPGHSPHAWRALGAPACGDIAAQLEEQQTLVPLSPEARGWRGMATAVRTCEEPPPEEVLDEEDVAPDADTAGVDLDLLDPFLDFELLDDLAAPEDSSPPGFVLAGAEVAGDPALLADLARALAAWTGDREVSAETKSGCVELSGTRPSEHPAEGRLSMDALEALRQLHLAAGALPAPLVVADPADGAVGWSLRLPAARGARHLFSEVAGRRLALPWHAVVTCGLGEAGQSHVVLGRGLERVALALDWLHGLGVGMRLTSPLAEPITFDTPALAGLPQLLEAEDGGNYIEVSVLPLEPAAEPAEVGADLDPAPEALQEPAPPADNPERSVPPVRVALVADDSFTSRVFLGRLLAQHGIAIDEAEDGSHALAYLAGRAYDLVFLDAGMPGGGAIDIAESLDEPVRASAVVLVRDDAERAAAQAAGFARVLYKPFAEDEVAAAVAALAEESRPGA
jgi:CheY-like chemotaxis protein